MSKNTHLRAINPPGATIPNVSMAMLAESGKLLFVSGHVPLRADGSIAGPGMEDQLMQVFENIGQTLAAAGTDFSSLARITIYVRDLTKADIAIIRTVRDRFINLECPPASALIGVADLFDPAVRIEIDAIAVVS